MNQINDNVLPIVKEDPKPEILIVTKNANGLSPTNYNVTNVVNSSLANFNFTLQSASSGCGLGLIANWIGLVRNVKFTKETRECFIKIIKRECTLNCWFCLMATLGDDYKERKNSSRIYEDFIESFGFKPVYSFENKNHEKCYQQTIYTVEVKDLK